MTAPATLASHPEIDRTGRLIEWYWQHGFRRGASPSENDKGEGDLTKYALPTDQWLAPLYDVRDSLSDLVKARQPRRPALGLWGLSQTGKSTALAFIDAGRVPPGKIEEDGLNTGLHWPGGQPFFYQPPYIKGGNYPDHWNSCSYNPFNNENDGSSCLTRLVAGSLDPSAGGWHVDDPQHPVGIMMLEPVELLNTMARGYDSQCLGRELENNGNHTQWTRESFVDLVTQFKQKRLAQRRSGDAVPPNRVAFERVLLLVRTISDLFAIRLATYAKLADDDASLRRLLEAQLLEQDTFISDPAAADEITAAILWGGAAFITERYVKLRKWHETLRAKWAGHKVRGSLATAMLFVDFNSGPNLLAGNATQIRQKIQNQLISALGYRRENGRVLIGCGPEYPEKLGATPEDYVMTQSLIWELVLPVNMGNLPESVAKNLLAAADILDFPGVGKEPLTGTTKLNLTTNLTGGKSPVHVDFYGKILKRGKTASVVANYARRMNIDAFAIMQSLKSDQPTDAEGIAQILQGCTAWARYSGFDLHPDSSAPLPLHFVLTFWGLKISNFRAGTQAQFENSVYKFVSNYDFVLNRGLVWALNYHWFNHPSVDVGDFAVNTPAYQAVVADDKFQLVFGRDPVSQRSFEEMVTDKTSGGLTYFFQAIVETLLAIDCQERDRRLAAMMQQQVETARMLYEWIDLRPPYKPHDARKDILEAFTVRLLDRSAPYNEARMREVSFALREALSVDAETLPLPPLDTEELTPAYIERLFFQWKEGQLRRFDNWSAGGKAGDGADWSHLACADRDQLGQVLQALIDALGQPMFGSVANCAQKWCKMLNQGSDSFRADQLRRLLAIEMCNRLLYFDAAEPDARIRTPLDSGRPKSGRESVPPGHTTQAYRAVVGPFLERQLVRVLDHIAFKPPRPALPGDPSLADILPPQEEKISA